MNMALNCFISHGVRLVKPIDKRLLGRPRRRWKVNIRIGLKEIGVSARNWVHSAHDSDYLRALVNASSISHIFIIIIIIIIILIIIIIEYTAC